VAVVVGVAVVHQVHLAAPVVVALAVTAQVLLAKTQATVPVQSRFLP
jgi:hypothetical protein